MPKSTNLLIRTKAFALEIIRLYGDLPSGLVAEVIGKQVLRSSTSVGAHVHEGKRSRSIAEMISKSEVALQELEESIYWLELLAESEAVHRQRLIPLFEEADEIVAMLVSAVRSLKRQNLLRSPQ